MIGATRFAGAYGSLWREVTPTLDLFVRKVNIELYERVEAPCQYEVEPNRSALIAETAFSLFDIRSRREADRPFFEQEIAESFAEARRRLSNLNVEHIEEDLNHDELIAVQELARRLGSYFACEIGEELVVRPDFPGCGFIDRAEGDVVYENALFEIKAVDRNFRSVDIKQLLTYAALNYRSGKYSFEDIGIYNPRRGTEFTMDLDDISKEVSGISAVELMEQLIYSIASGEVSR